MSKQTREELREIVQRWIAEGWQKGNVEAVRAMCAPGFVDLNHPDSPNGSRDENARRIAELYAAFPDYFAEIDFLIIDEHAGRVALHWTARGTHRGTFYGVEPTGNVIVFRGVETLMIENGLIVERSGHWDALEILRQMGVRLWVG